MRTILIAILFAGVASADVIGTVTLNTSALIGSPYTLDFQFIDGNGVGDGNNSVTLSGFNAGGGSINTTPSFSFGSKTVQTTPAFSAQLADSSFFSELQFALTPGSSLQFQVDATTNNDATGPDSFTFGILDQNGNPVPTTSFFDVFFELDLPTGTTPPVSTSSGTDPQQTELVVNAPTFSTTVPEPSSVVPAFGAAAGLVWMRRRRRV